MYALHPYLTSRVTVVTVRRVVQSGGEEDGYGDQRRQHGGGYQAGWVLGGVLVLGEVGVHQLRGSCGADCDHAQGAGREEAVGLRATVPADAELLHAPARTRGPAGGHLHRVEAARDAWWHRGWLLLRHTVYLRVAVALVP